MWLARDAARGGGENGRSSVAATSTILTSAAMTGTLPSSQQEERWPASGSRHSYARTLNVIVYRTDDTDQCACDIREAVQNLTNQVLCDICGSPSPLLLPKAIRDSRPASKGKGDGRRRSKQRRHEATDERVPPTQRCRSGSQRQPATCSAKDDSPRELRHAWSHEGISPRRPAVQHRTGGEAATFPFLVARPAPPPDEN